MKNLYDVLRQKEQEIKQLQKEIEALRLAASLLSEEPETAPAAAVVRAAAAISPTSGPQPIRANADSAPKAAAWDDDKRWP
jgi:hypothetical protein